MPPTSTADIRCSYLDFFKSRGHAVISGASLVPENDPTVLFTTAGMHPLVPYLMGEKHPLGKRLVDAQLCVRTQDIDEVGDASHLTCFEMLGNWSLGDYFKEGAIQLSVEFLTRVLELPMARLGVTCFAGDSDAPKDTESAGYWKKAGIPEERIGFLPKAKNWWGPAGKTGPCGPDTEMFYWIGKAELPLPGSNPANDEANWMEIWNDVFMQYNKKGDGTFEPLSQQNVDTGMGLERVAVIMQNVKSVYETDNFRSIYTRVRELVEFPQISNDPPAQNERDAMRIIVDHLRAATFIIADGILPSNVDQGYVLRRLIRRSLVKARTMGIKEEGSFCSCIADAVIHSFGNVYPKLQKNAQEIKDVLNGEEKKFSKTVIDAFAEYEFALRVSPGEEYPTRIFRAEQAFNLFTTYGLPIDLMKEESEHRKISLEKDFDQKYKQLFEQHQALSRVGAEKKFAGGLADHSAETTKLHTATHLLNAALRKVLGDHVFQKGSNITAERLRFDFSHPDKMTPEQIRAAEDYVNEAIKADAPIFFRVMTVDEAKEAGAIGVFESKYGERVKVYEMGPFSREICGGPHVARTGMLGSFKIQKEESSSAGVRRMKATVANGPLEIEVAREGE